jgi:glycine cleavage system H protein
METIMNPDDFLLIYSAKGIEYLIALGFLIIFIPFWRFVNAPGERQPAIVNRVVERVSSLVEGFLVPEQVYFHPGHAWVKLAGNNLVTVGMSDFAQKLLGKPETIQLPEVGSLLKQGERGWGLALDSKVIDMLSPVEGQVVAINERVFTDPDHINQDPYGEGWLLQVKAPKLSVNLKNLLSGELARKWMEAVGESLWARMNMALGPVSQDGGIPIQGMARSLDQERWDQIAREFFLTADQEAKAGFDCRRTAGSTGGGA